MPEYCILAARVNSQCNLLGVKSPKEYKLQHLYISFAKGIVVGNNYSGNSEMLRILDSLRSHNAKTRRKLSGDIHCLSRSSKAASSPQS